MTRGWWGAAVAAALLMQMAQAQAEGAVEILTEDLPPYNYGEGGEVLGVATEVVKAMMNRLGDKSTIEVVPWKRGYAEALNKPDVGLYSTTRLPQREALFQWVGPLVDYHFTLMRRGDDPSPMPNLETARLVETIGVQGGGAAEGILNALGFANLRAATNEDLNLEMLLAKRLDYWMSDDLEVKFRLKRKGMPENAIVPALLVEKRPMYLVFGLKTRATTVAAWQDALNRLIADGAYTKILARYR